MRKPRDLSPMDDIPWGYGVDGGLIPTEPKYYEKQGLAAIHHKNGWTALSFPDRTIDHRRASHSTFLLENEDATFEEMIGMVEDRFPEIMGRFTFPIILVEGQ